jgi:hypothetical protein
MLQGVEHETPKKLEYRLCNPLEPLMPQGVEHGEAMKYVGGTAISRTSDAVRR